ncbi:MAG: ABC transporter substrate-binding protein [Mariprofundales bacterium]|nr:ABC transporter substrate-binding protein [Mariprofundales bacterium]
MIYKFSALIVALTMSFSVWMPAATAATVASRGPEQVVTTTVQAIIKILNHRQDKKHLNEHDRQQIRAILEGNFNFREMARHSMGPPWRQLDDAHRNEFVSMFRQIMEYTYGNRLSGYHGQTIAYNHAEFRRNKARIQSRVTDGSTITPVDYLLKKSSAGWLVYDIKIEGVSMINTFRQDFSGVIDHKGIDGFFQALHKKVAALIAKDQSTNG